MQCQLRFQSFTTCALRDGLWSRLRTISSFLFERLCIGSPWSFHTWRICTAEYCNCARWATKISVYGHDIRQLETPGSIDIYLELIALLNQQRISKGMEFCPFQSTVNVYYNAIFKQTLHLSDFNQRLTVYRGLFRITDSPCTASNARPVSLRW